MTKVLAVLALPKASLNSVLLYPDDNIIRLILFNLNVSLRLYGNKE
jgi:hypothetical protein